MSTIHEPPVLRGSDGAEPSWAGPPPASPRASSGRGWIVAFIAAIVAVALTAAMITAWATRHHNAAPAVKTSLDVSAIAATVAPAVVDVNSTLGYSRGLASGTGIVLTSAGEVLTNNHVVEGATAISVHDVGNGRTYKATVVGYDETGDIAVLQLQGASGLKTAPLGDSSAVRTSDSVVAIGNAGGKGGTPSATTGTVMALGVSITATDESASTAENLTGLIQTNANLQAGDSGGPLVDSSGQVIGINTAASTGFQFQSATAGSPMGFAIPVNKAISVAAGIESGRSSATVHIGATAFLGVQLLNSAAGLPGGPASSGVTVAGVEAGSPAQLAGLAAGDMITSVDGQAVDSPSAVAAVLEQHHPGDKIGVSWMDQYGQEHTATVVLATGPVG